jgi:hypothetical protein
MSATAPSPPPPSLLARLSHLVLGRPLRTAEAQHQRLAVWAGLVIMSSDAISSVAYAADEILSVLVGAAAPLFFALPVAGVIVAMLGAFLIGYLRVIATHPQGGGSFLVTRENLGDGLSLVAAAALLTDYTLTVAVSLTAGVDNLAAAVPSLAPHKVVLDLAFLLVLVLGNLRGVREAGALFALPTFGFIASAWLTMAVTFGRLLITGHPAALPPQAPAGITQPMTLWIVLLAFSNGSTALTGIEAIADGVPVFEAPSTVNAQRAMAIMCAILASLFLPSIYLATRLALRPTAGQTVLVDLAAAAFGHSVGFYLLPAFTMAILLMAGNTSFADYPRLFSWLARYQYAPSQMANRGGRLTFHNGILLLATTVAALIVGFHGSTAALIPLYAIGVFTAICLSQTSMTVRWWRGREPGWARNVLANGFGAALAGVVLVVIIATKFTSGAWAIVAFVPLAVAALSRVHGHYRQVHEQIALPGDDEAARTTLRRLSGALGEPVAVLPVAGVNRITGIALALADRLSSDVRTVYCGADPGETTEVRQEWVRAFPDRPLTVLPSPYRSIVEPLREYVRALRAEHPARPVVLVVPEVVPRRWWQQALHNQTALFLKGAFLFEPGVYVMSVPYWLREKGD